jgi:hypothetical protein
LDYTAFSPCKCTIEGTLWVGALNGSQNQNISDDDADAAAAGTTMIVSAWTPIEVTLSEDQDGPPGVVGTNNGDGTVTYSYYHISVSSGNFNPNQSTSTEAPGSYKAKVEVDCAPFYTAVITAAGGWKEEDAGGHAGVYGSLSGPAEDCGTDITDANGFDWTIVRTGHQIWQDPGDESHWAVIAVDDTVTPLDLSTTSGGGNGIDGFLTKDSNGNLGAIGGEQVTLWGAEDPSASPQDDAYAYLNSSEPALYINDTAGDNAANTQAKFTTDNIYIKSENDAENIDLSIDPDNGKAEINVNSGGYEGACFFGMELHDTDGISKLTLEAGGRNQFFEVKCNDTDSTSKLELSQKDADEYFHSRIDSDLGVSQASGSAGGTDGAHYSLLADDDGGICSASVYNDTSNQLVHMKVDEAGTAEVYGIAGGSPYFMLKANDNDAEAYLYLNDGESANATLNTTELKLTDGEHTVTIDIPDDGDAKWQEISICVDGESKTMKVLGTDPT